MTPITKNNKSPQFDAKGMIPIEKNIIVTDEQGNILEATYPKRAKGLVKNGRARYIDENTICLACPPMNMEDKNMSENTENKSVNQPEEIIETEKLATDGNKFTLNYVLEQIEKIASETQYLNNVVENLGKMTLDFSEEYNYEAYKSQAEALGDAVRCRETTNQQLLRFYEKMYDDLKVTELQQKSGTTAQLESVTNWFKTLNRADFDPIGWNAITDAVKTQLSRHY